LRDLAHKTATIADTTVKGFDREALPIKYAKIGEAALQE